MLQILSLLVLLSGVLSKHFGRPQSARSSAINDLTRNMSFPDSQLVPRTSGPCVSVGSKFDPQVLRILPLGASIVWGLGASDLTGFRQDLRNMLIANGANVNYVGSVENGDMIDDDVEGWPGLRIDQVAVKAENSLPFLPNLVLIHVGTNDAVQNYDIANAHIRLGSLIDRIFRAIPDVVVIVSTIIPNGNATKEANIKIINSNIPSMVADRVNQGDKLFMVDMHDGYITYPADIHTGDKTHPTDVGYVKLANKWYGAIQQVYSNCWITPPAPVAGLSDLVPAGVLNTICYPLPRYGVGPSQQRVKSGKSDGEFLPNFTVIGQLNLNIPNKAKGLVIDGVYWADVDGDGVDDFIWVGETKEMIVCISIGGGEESNNGCYVNNNRPSCTRRGVRFGDFDGDGRDDFLCITYPSGGLLVWLNQAGGENPGNPNWIALGEVKQPVDGFISSDILLGDIDGDGRIDFLAVNRANGEIFGWRHGGTGTAPYNWQEMGLIMGSETSSEFDMTGDIRFIDLNGDGRDDFVEVRIEPHPGGAIFAAMNQRGSSLSLAPSWQNIGLAFGPFIDVKNTTQIKFGNIYGKKDWNTYTDQPGGGSDVSIATAYGSPQTVPNGISTYLDVVWLRNTGSGGTRQPGDLVRWCDMRGRGYDDTVSIEVDGTIGVHGSILQVSDKDYGNVFSPTEDMMTGISPLYHPGNLGIKDVHLADLDGDGRCDYLIVNPFDGSVRMIRNDYSEASDTFAWTDVGIVSAGVDCKNSYGPGQFDLGTRFADLDGDKKADYLCIDPDGRTTAFMNKGLNAFQSVGQIKYSQRTDRANIRYVDVNGDGKADYLHLNKFNGAVAAWINFGAVNPATNNGSSIHWNYRDIIEPANRTRGDCVNFANLNGQVRSDILYLEPATAVVSVYLNVCPLRNPSPPMTILPPLPDPPTTPDQLYLVYASFGDSYASGVEYGSGNNFDGDKSTRLRCKRWMNAYAVALRNDPDQSWARGKVPYLRFVACSGSNFDILRDQIGQIGGSGYPPSFATLQIGGNDSGFFNIISHCLLQQEELPGGSHHLYGPEYPDPAGECYSAIVNAQNIVNDPNWADRLNQRYDEILSLPYVVNDSNFKLFHLGYARFFNTMDTGCDDYSFVVFSSLRCEPSQCDEDEEPAPKVTRELRLAINNLVTGVNANILTNIRARNDPRIQFIDIDPLFENKRWCEPASSFREQNDNSWFWQWPTSNYVSDGLPLGIQAVPFNITDDMPPNSTTVLPLDTTACTTIGNFNYSQDWNDQLLCSWWQDENNPTALPSDASQQGSDGLDSGYLTRIYHPKIPGHAAIKDLIKQTVAQDYHG